MRLLEVIARGADRRARAGARARGRRGDGQAGDRGRRRPRLPGEPLHAAVRRRGAAAGAGARGHARAGGPHLPPRRRLPDGPVRADGPGRDRRGLRRGAIVQRAVLRRAALEAQPAAGADGGRGAAGAQDGARLVRVRRRPHRPEDAPAPEGTGADFEAEAAAAGLVRCVEQRSHRGRPRARGVPPAAGRRARGAHAGAGRARRRGAGSRGAGHRGRACTTSGWATRRGWCSAASRPAW